MRPGVSLLAACLALACALLVSVESGSARAPELVSSATPEALEPVAASRRRVLRGRRRVTRFVVPKRDTIVVRGAVQVTAQDEITVAGRVLVAPGGRLTLRAGETLTLARGSSILPEQRRSLAAPGPAAAAGASAAGPIELVGHSIDIQGHVVTAPGQHVLVRANERGTVRIDGHLATGAGADSTDRRLAGGRSGSIVVSGGLFGKARTITLGRRARLETGDGGTGYDDATGQLRGVLNPCGDPRSDPPGGANRRQLFVEATDGGDAGAIRLLARNYDLRGKIALGDGGRGGHAGFARREGPRAKAPDGSPGHGGADVYAQSGSGGHGGSFETEDGDGAARAGAGGDAGDVRVAAGDGGANCDGGRTEARLGVPGKRGKRGARPLGTAELGSIELVGGGHGGAASDRDHAGGNGGLVRLENAGSPRDPVAVTDYASGGAGFNGCSASPPVNGTPGGDGGAVRAGTKSYVVATAFRGARGGDGIPAGDGGTAGSNDRGPDASLDSFRAGGRGSPCPNVAVRLEASNLQLGWVSPFTGNPVTGTYAMSFCGNDPFTQVWRYTGTVTDGPFGFNGSFLFGVSPLMPVRAYNDLSGNPVASVAVRFALSGQLPTLTLEPTPVLTGSTSLVDPGPSQVELVGQFVSACP